MLEWVQDNLIGSIKRGDTFYRSELMLTSIKYLIKVNCWRFLLDTIAWCITASTADAVIVSEERLRSCWDIPSDVEEPTTWTLDSIAKLSEHVKTAICCVSFVLLCSLKGRSLEKQGLLHFVVTFRFYWKKLWCCYVAMSLFTSACKDNVFRCRRGGLLLEGVKQHMFTAQVP